jgi:hypothetical protein
MGATVRPQASLTPELATIRAPEARSQVNRAELEQRLADIERQIEGHRTAIWLAERDRDEARHELRRLLHAETKETTV